MSANDEILQSSSLVCVCVGANVGVGPSAYMMITHTHYRGMCPFITRVGTGINALWKAGNRTSEKLRRCQKEIP